MICLKWLGRKCSQVCGQATKKRSCPHPAGPQAALATGAHRTAPCRSCRAGACCCVEGASEPPGCVPPMEPSSIRCGHQMYGARVFDIWAVRQTTTNARSARRNAAATAAAGKARKALGPVMRVCFPSTTQHTCSWKNMSSEPRKKGRTAGRGEPKRAVQARLDESRHGKGSILPRWHAPTALHHLSQRAHPALIRNHISGQRLPTGCRCPQPAPPLPALISMAARLFSFTVMAPPSVARPARILDMRAF